MLARPDVNRAQACRGGEGSWGGQTRAGGEKSWAALTAAIVVRKPATGASWLLWPPPPPSRPARSCGRAACWMDSETSAGRRSSRSGRCRRSSRASHISPQSEPKVLATLMHGSIGTSKGAVHRFHMSEAANASNISLGVAWLEPPPTATSLATFLSPHQSRPSSCQVSIGIGRHPTLGSDCKPRGLSATRRPKLSYRPL